MRVLLLGGAGTQGSRIARLLAQENSITELVVSDLDAERAKRVAQEVGASAGLGLDIRDHTALLAAARNTDLIGNFAGPYSDTGLPGMRAAVEAGVHYVDINDDLNVSDLAAQYSGEAERRGCTLVLGIGGSPGLTNLWARAGADRLERVDRIGLNWIASISVFARALWIHRMGMASASVPVCRAGQIQEIQAWTEEESLDFPPPIGRQTVRVVGHGEPLMLHASRALLKEPQAVVCKGGYWVEEFNSLLTFLRDARLCTTEPLQVGESPIVPVDFMVEFLTSRYFVESPLFQRITALDAAKGTGFGVVVYVEGEKHGVRTRCTFRGASADRNLIITGPAVAAIMLLADGTITQRGVLFPEALPSEPVLNSLRKRMTWEEEMESLEDTQISPT